MDTVISTDGTRIAFDRIGDGPPLILIGGAFNDRNSPVAGRPIAEFLASSFTVFTYDRRGRGDSGDTPPYAVAREVEDLAALVQVAGGSPGVYGHSSGAVLALQGAAHGLPISRLALYEPPLVEHGDGPARIAEHIAAGQRGEAVEVFMGMVGIPREVVAQMRQAPMWGWLERMAHTLVYDNTITDDPSVLAERAITVRVPTLCIDGSDSDPRLRTATRAVAEAVPGAQYRTLAGQTHDVNPSVLAPVLAEFFRN